MYIHIYICTGYTSNNNMGNNKYGSSEMCTRSSREIGKNNEAFPFRPRLL